MLRKRNVMRTPIKKIEGTLFETVYRILYDRYMKRRVLFQ